MDSSPAIAAALAALAHVLDESGPDDIQANVESLLADLKRAVPSFIGMTVTIALDDHEVSFTVHADGPIKPATSLLIPLESPAPSAAAASTLLLHAATPGAFVDLAADLSYALSIELSRLILDGHLELPEHSDGLSGLDDYAAINQATGILIGRGNTPEAARAELQRLAALDHGSLRAAADTLIRSVADRPRD